MINKENLLKNRAAVQGNRSYLEQQGKSVKVYAPQTVVADSPPEPERTLNGAPVFNMRGLKSNLFGSNIAVPSSSSVVKKNDSIAKSFEIKSSSSKPSVIDKQDIKLEQLRKQAAMRNSLLSVPINANTSTSKVNVSTNQPVVHSSNSLSKKLAMKSQSLSGSNISLNKTNSTNNVNTTSNSCVSVSQPVKATNRSILDSLYSNSVTDNNSNDNNKRNSDNKIKTNDSEIIGNDFVERVVDNSNTVTYDDFDVVSSSEVAPVQDFEVKVKQQPVISTKVSHPVVNNPIGSIVAPKSNPPIRVHSLDEMKPNQERITYSTTVLDSVALSDSEDDTDTYKPPQSSSFTVSRPHHQSKLDNTISDNFVRRNLKQKKFSYKKDRKSNNNNSSSNGNGYSGMKYTGSDSDSDRERGVNSAIDGHNVGGGGNMDSGVAAVGGGLASWGLDPLALSLQAIEVVQSENKNIPSANKNSTTIASSSASTKNCSKVIRMDQIIANVNINKDITAKKVRGIDLDMEVTHKKEKRNATVLYGIQKLTNNKSSGGQSGSKVDEVQLLLEKYAPKCPGHQMAAKLITVKKSGANKGKQFYVCAFPKEQQCKFFMWAEDNPELINATIKTTKSAKPTEATVPTTTKPLSAEEEWVVHAIGAYQVKLQGLSKSELKDEIIRCNQKNILRQGKKQAVRLNVGGSISEMIERLSSEALRVLTADQQCLPCEQQNEDVMELSESESDENKDSHIALSDSDESMIVIDKPMGKNNTKNKVVKTKKNDVNESYEESSIVLSDSEASDSLVDSDDSNKNKKRKRPVARKTTKQMTNFDDFLDQEDDLMNSIDVNESDAISQILRKSFGFTVFREGQRWAIERAINGQSSLLVLPTGTGKSLCYMLPAIALPGLTIVISPLLSLMNDQLKKLPVELPGACFSGNLTAQRAAYLCENILKGHIKILYISPERLCTPAFHRLIRLLKQQNADPVVSLLCIDEAHCLSQWSYNFRPSFLRIKREIRSIAPRAVLALTATASSSIQKDIMTHLSIESEGLLALPSHRKNLMLSSCIYENNDIEKKRAMILKLVKQPISELHSNGNSAKKSRVTPLTIVYVWRRDEADSLGEYIQANNVDTVIYHAGMDSEDRDKAQQKFDRGTVSCVVATVAFGMGVDKSDVRQIIHHSMPKAIENYIQEVGRAGRDGKLSACRLFCSREDVTKQHSLGNSNRLTSIQIMGLMMNVFALKNSSDTATSMVPIVDRVQPNVAIPLSTTENNLDISSASIETILSILELPPFHLVSVKGTYYDTIAGRFRKSTTDLKQFESDLLIKAILKLNEVKTKTNAVNFKLGNSMSAGSYGMGFGNYGGINESDDENQSNTYGDTIMSFTCSRLALSKECDLTPEEVTNGMYSLQRRGILEYTLTNSSLYVTINNSSDITDECLIQMSSAKNYFSWLNSLSVDILNVLNTITDLAGERITNMWKVANTIAKFSSIETSTISNNSDNVVQEALQLFVSQAMDADQPITNCESNSLLNDIRQFYESEVPTAFMDSTLLLSITDQSLQLTSRQSDVKRKLTADILLLQRDPTLNESIDHILQHAKFETLIKQQVISMKVARSQIMSLYICKVLHGLSSTNVLHAVWKDSSPVWGKYKEYCYDDLMRSVSHLLNSSL